MANGMDNLKDAINVGVTSGAAGAELDAAQRLANNAKLAKLEHDMAAARVGIGAGRVPKAGRETGRQRAITAGVNGMQRGVQAGGPRNVDVEDFYT